MNWNLKEPFRKCAETVRPRLKKANRSFWRLWTVARWTRYDLFLCGLVFFVVFFIALSGFQTPGGTYSSSCKLPLKVV